MKNVSGIVRLVALGLTVVGTWCAVGPELVAAEQAIDVGAARVIIGQRASSQEQFAARELQRYLSRLDGRVPSAGRHGPDDGVSFVLGTPAGNPQVARLADKLSLSPEAVGDEGYHLKAFSDGAAAIGGRGGA